MYQAIYCDKKASVVHLWDDVNGYVRVPYSPYAYRKSLTGKYESIYGDKLERTERFSYGDPRLFESDVPWDTRVLIDAYEDSDEASINHRVAVIDLEVDSTNGYPDIKNPTQKITAIALYDSANDRYYCFVLDEECVVTNEDKDNTSVIAFRYEENLLGAFLDKWKEIKPTIATGWNIDGFDFPYLHARLTFLFGEDRAADLSPIGICYFNKYKNKMCIAGINCMDYLLLYKKYIGKSLPNYRLDTVGKEELKIGKVEYEGSLDNLMKTDMKKFIEYNLHDVKLVKMLNDSLQFIELAMSICHVCHVGYEEFSVPSKFLEGALLTYLRRNRKVAPNKRLIKKDADPSVDGDYPAVDSDDDDDDAPAFEGAYVKDPIPGRYEWVCSADIASLYPSVIMSLNISPETKVAVIAGWKTEKFVKKSSDTVVYGGNDYTYAQLSEVFVEKNLSVSANGVVYDQKRSGCIPDILKKWYSERVEFKDKMKAAQKSGDKPQYVFWKRRQQVQKILLNSLYGVLGLEIFRFYDLDNAAAVTLTGQDIIKTSARHVNVKFNKRCNTVDKDYVIYIDTDSLYLDINSIIKHENITDPKPFAIETIRSVSNELNEMYKVLMVRMFNSTDNRIVIAADVVASSAFWIIKKRYAMLKVYNMEEGKDMNDIEIKGLDVVRSSYPQKFRVFMKSVLDDILRGTSNDELNTKVLTFKRTMKTFELQDIAKNTSVRFAAKKPPFTNFDPHDRDPFNFIKGSTAQCKAALAYNDMLKYYKIKTVEPILSGGKIKWAYLRANEFGLDGIAFKDDGFDPKIVMDFLHRHIDRTQIWNAELEKKLKMFYSAMNWELYNENMEKLNKFLVKKAN